MYWKMWDCYVIWAKSGGFWKRNFFTEEGDFWKLWRKGELVKGNPVSKDWEEEIVRGLWSTIKWGNIKIEKRKIFFTGKIFSRTLKAQQREKFINSTI